MKQLINITLSFEGEKFIKCDYVWLEPHAPNTGRKFVFSGFKTSKKTANYDSIINVNITVCNNLNEWVYFIDYDIFVLNYGCLSEDLWWVYGTVFNIGDMEYVQGKIDTFNIWQKGGIFDWFSIPIKSPLKLDYIGACLTYSGIITKMIEKEVYNFDISLVKEERDFFYLASLEFFGDRSYFGHDLHTFKDCLLEMFNHNGYFDNKEIIFFNPDKIYNSEIVNFFEDIKNEFIKYKFMIK
ncbi:MAG: hypothetical protein H7329_02780 [Opitutaceae bacterium]|nr:hypothetical protein [Cytophagales bacterium]